ncbi:DNA-binding transcriptional regulator, MarR family [Pedococcus dokdonensis]|uniref:DNA-binding transcriptional regulator, MarR family n=1 Tax=Pedococcus dokdonensis TaxID=443156 RepID=A0A1H0TSW5_9MICO|nr:DNA-binding transcriptional regulator, MarR family [Pedococcus dokdonensis]
MARTRQAAIERAGRAMQRYQRSVQSFDDAVGRALGLGPADMRCLDVLSERPCSAGELSAATGLRPAATTALIDRLVDKGFVERRPSEADRRKVLVALTDDGARKTWAAYGPLVSEGQQGFASTTIAELERLSDLVDGMTELTDRHRARIERDASPD